MDQETPLSPQEALFKEVVDAAGGLTKLADALGFSLQRVNNWRATGFPAPHCKAIEALSGISVTRLRPNDWRAYWPDAEKAFPQPPRHT